MHIATSSKRFLDIMVTRSKAAMARSPRSVAVFALLLPFCLFLLVFKVSTQPEAVNFDDQGLDEFTRIILDEKALAKLDKLEPLPTDVSSPPLCSCSDARTDATITGSSLPSTKQPWQQETDEDLPTIFVITPTYTRPTQLPDMTRLAQTLMLVRNVFWIVVEDSHKFSGPVRKLLERTRAPFAHLLGPRPITHLDPRSGRGVSNRLRALRYLREQYGHTNISGVLYFADDDNAYDLRVFDEIRYTKKVSVFPVGAINDLGISSPVLNVHTGQVVGFHDPFLSSRTFALDMAGFAVNLQFFFSKPKATMPYKVGYEEDFFLKSLEIRVDQLEPKAHNCTEVYVWHTKTKPAVFPLISNLHLSLNHTNLGDLYRNILNNDL